MKKIKINYNYFDEDYKPAEIHSFKDTLKLEDCITNSKVKCKCGHTVLMADVDRTICTYCGYWVYKTPQLEFAYKLKEQMIKNSKQKEFKYEN